MQINLIMQLTLKLSKYGICADAVDLSQILTRYGVAISHIGSPKYVTFCVCEIGRFHLDYRGFLCRFVRNIWIIRDFYAGLGEIILQFIL